jgi:hypothetical protein
MDIPKGPVKGHLSTVATMLFIREAAGWRLARFHNSKRESTEPPQPRDAGDDFRSGDQPRAMA